MRIPTHDDQVPLMMVSLGVAGRAMHESGGAPYPCRRTATVSKTTRRLGSFLTGSCSGAAQRLGLKLGLCLGLCLEAEPACERPYIASEALT